MSDATEGETVEKPADNRRAFAMTAIGILGMTAAAFVFGFFLKTSPIAHLSWRFRDAGLGVAATAPMGLLLYWFANTRYPPLARFRNAQVEFFAGIGFEFTPVRIAVMAIGAGISEEMIFRGVLQLWAARHMPLAAAIILPNIIFGALHARTLLYAIIAGMIGVYLGVLFATTSNLLAPIVAHAVYDAIALEYTRRAIAEKRQSAR